MLGYVKPTPYLYYVINDKSYEKQNEIQLCRYGV